MVCRLPAGGGSLGTLSEAKFPASGEIQCILFVYASECDYWLEINSQIQWFTTQFPTHRNREFNSALQGIESGHQGIFSPNQGIRRWPRFHCDVKPNVRPTH